MTMAPGKASIVILESPLIGGDHSPIHLDCCEKVTRISCCTTGDVYIAFLIDGFTTMHTTVIACFQALTKRVVLASLCISLLDMTLRPL